VRPRPSPRVTPGVTSANGLGAMTGGGKQERRGSGVGVDVPRLCSKKKRYGAYCGDRCSALA